MRHQLTVSLSTTVLSARSSCRQGWREGKAWHDVGEGISCQQLAAPNVEACSEKKVMFLRFALTWLVKTLQECWCSQASLSTAHTKASPKLKLAYANIELEKMPFQGIFKTKNNRNSL